jgi:hypothetical protein
VSVVDDWTCDPCIRGQHDDCEPVKNLPEGVRGVLVCVCRRTGHGLAEQPLPEANDDQPDSPVQALVNAAAWLDGYDRMALGIARQLPEGDAARGSLEQTAANDEVQTYLLRMARWLMERPSIAELMWLDTQSPAADAT